VHAIVLETLEVSLQLSGQVLRTLGEKPHSILALLDRLRKQDFGDLVDREIATTSIEPLDETGAGNDAGEQTGGLKE
jgi:hypothetical protein